MHLMDLPSDDRGIFISRPNRFLANVHIDGMEVLAHIHDPGRLTEILVPGTPLMLRRAPSVKRRTSYDVIAGRTADRWVLINSSFHRPLSVRILGDPSISPFGEANSLHSEVRYGGSRIDHLLEIDGRKMFVEVKGCSLTEEGTALFPDAPTSRGTRHLKELTNALREGYRAGLLVLVMRNDSQRFRPNSATDPDFTSALWEAVDAGLEVRPMVLGYDGASVTLERAVPLVP